MNSNQSSSSSMAAAFAHKKYMNEWLANTNSNAANANININNNTINPNGSYQQQRSLDGWLNAALKSGNSTTATPETFSMSSMLDGVTRGSAELTNSNQLNHHNNTVNIEPPSQYFPSHLHPPMHALRMSNHSADFTSLPPGVNLNQESNKSGSQNDLLDGLENRRFSDPCLAANSDEDDATDPAGRKQKTNAKHPLDNTKLLSTLIQQINILHDTNSKICRNLNDTKVDVEALKHAPSWGFRHRRDSISGFSTHSQPAEYPFGTHSPAPTFHSGMYTPGMMTDVVREVKEAARVREDALLSRVRALVEERSWTMNDTQMKLIRNMEEMKIQMNRLKAERYETKGQIARLEEEVKSLRVLLMHALNVDRTNQTSNPVHTPQLNKSLPMDRHVFLRQNSNASIRSTPQDRSKRHSLNLNYGTVHQDDSALMNGFAETLFDNDSVIDQDKFNELLKEERMKYVNGNGAATTTTAVNSNGELARQSTNEIYVNGDDNDALGNGALVQMEKDNLDLRRELQDALANKKHADKKIQTLENLVKSLQGKGTSTLISENGNNVVTITTTSSRTNNSQEPMAKPQRATQIKMITTSPSVKPTTTTATSNGNGNGGGGSGGTNTSSTILSGPVTDL